MKIRIITIHGIPNFGSVYQAYALCNYLINAGYVDTEIIDYNPRYFIPHSLRSIVGKLLNYKAYRIREKKFRHFVKENIPLTVKKYTTIQELKVDFRDAGVFIAGGDQLWNVFYSCGHDDAYKLTFAKGRKISYATSMGQSGFTDTQLRNLARKIRDFSAVSVRESSSIGLLKRVGIDAVQCVDPVFLLNTREYAKFIRPVHEPKYLLVYLVTPSELLEQCVTFLSKKYSLKVILCSGFSKKCTCDKFIKDLGPDEMLSYIANAELILSSSFHAMAFSLMFEKQFFTILPSEQTNERITDLLSEMELSDRIVTNQTQLETALVRTIDYRNVIKMTGRVEYSKKYLKDALKEIL